MISLLVASHVRGACFILALSNLWLDDGGGTIANFYDKHGLTQQGNVEFMRNFGLEKQFVFCVDAALKKHMSPSFDRQSHGSNGHPDLNMSEF